MVLEGALQVEMKHGGAGSGHAASRTGNACDVFPEAWRVFPNGKSEGKQDKGENPPEYLLLGSKGSESFPQGAGVPCENTWIPGALRGRDLTTCRGIFAFPLFHWIRSLVDEDLLFCKDNISMQVRKAIEKWYSRLGCNFL